MPKFDDQLFTSTASLQSKIWEGLPDQQMMASYDQTSQPTAGFYNSMSSSSTVSPLSDGSPPPGASRRASQAFHESKGAFPNKVERRREQNRQSQRAYRDRKDKHQQQLEGQIAVWKQKHEKLVKSYAKQTEEVSQLRAQLEDLNAQVASLQSRASEPWGGVDLFQPDFDTVPFYDKKAGAWSRGTFDS